MAKGDVSTYNEDGVWKSKVEGSARCTHQRHQGGTNRRRKEDGQGAQGGARHQEVGRHHRREELLRRRPEPAQGLRHPRVGGSWAHEPGGDDKHGDAGRWVSRRTAMVLAECPHVRGLPSEGTTAQLRRWVQPGALRAGRSLVGGGCDGAEVAGAAPAIFVTALGTDSPDFEPRARVYWPAAR